MEPLADNVKDTCARLGCSPSTFYRLVADQAISPIKLRGRTLVTRTEQLRFLAALPKA